jgi:hypothetical protein
MIDIWLKIKNRGNLEFLLSNLSFWLGVFSDSRKYKIMIYSEDVELPRWYKERYKIYRKSDLLNNISCVKVFDKIEKAPFAHWWKPAAKALSAPYLFLEDSENDLIFNIDSDDLILIDFKKKYIEEAIKLLIDENLTTLSYDLNYSYHVLPENRTFQPHHWSFGVNLADRSKMKSIILKSIWQDFPPKNPPWSYNLDYIVGVELEKTDDKYLTFTSPAKLLHHAIDKSFHYCKYNMEKKQIEANRCGVLSFAEKHPRSYLIT